MADEIVTPTYATESDVTNLTLRVSTLEAVKSLVIEPANTTVLESRIAALEALVPTLESISKQLHVSFFSNPGFFPPPVPSMIEEITNE